MVRTCLVREQAAILLMGLRGSGKSTLGPELARRLGRPFIDLDLLTAATLRTQHQAPPTATISDLFRQLGEGAFRTVEAEQLKQVLALPMPRPVVALGGGTPTAPGAAELLRKAANNNTALVIYLRLSPDALAERLSAAHHFDQNANRPALLGQDPISEIAQVFAARDPLYYELADSTLELDGLSVDQSLQAIATVLASHGVLMA